MTDKESNTGKFYTNYSFEYPKENVKVATSSFQDVPTNEEPLINLTVNGILRPSEEKVHEIKMIFEGDVPQKDKLAASYGTFVLCKGVYNAAKIMKTLWDKEKNTLTILIDLRREKIRPRRPAQFSFSVQIDDVKACPNPCGVKNWGNNCGDGRTFNCKTFKGNETRNWQITRAGDAADCWYKYLSLKNSTGKKCGCLVDRCECFNNLAEVSSKVCKTCAKKN